jgi:adenine-specific DNA-methyltransferase
MDSPLIKKWLNDTVNADDLSRSDKWLCMMYPRLKLLRELLKDDGVIFISIDDAEVYNLKLVCDEIFGKDNFIANLPTIMNLKGNNDQFGFAGTHEYTLVYSKNIDKVRLYHLPDLNLKEWKKDKYGFYKKGANLKATGEDGTREKRPNLFFPVYIDKDDNLHLERISKEDIEIYPKTDNKDFRWRWSREKFENEKYNLIINRNKNGIAIYKKQRPQNSEVPTKKPKSIFIEPKYSSGNGTNELKAIFGNKPFPYPKPKELVKDFIRIGTNKNDLILDSFSGSGTTSQAVLELNNEDSKNNRKFILIEMEKEVAENITRTRAKYIVNKIGGGFKYCELSHDIFDELGELNSNLTFEQIAKHIYFVEFKKPIDKNSINQPFVGTHKNNHIYFYEKKFLNKDLKDLLDEYKKIKKEYKQLIIYTAKSTVSNDTLKEKNIIIRYIPYDIKDN